MRIYYEVHGPAGAPAMLLVPTAGGDHTRWAQNVGGLAERYRVVLFDPRITGQTEAPAEPFTLRDIAADAVSVLDAGGIEQAAVVGASMGGLVAQELALGWPERVWALVLACTTAGGALATLSHEERGAEMGRIMKLPPGERGLAFARTLFGGRAVDGDPAAYANIIAEAGWDEEPFPSFGPNAHLQNAAISAFDASDRVQGIAAPTLVLHGDDDLSIPDQDGRNLAAAIPGAAFQLLSGGLFFTQQPALFNEAVLQFLDRLRPAAAGEPA